MAPKDYVARGQNKKQAAVPPKSKFPVLPLLIVLGLVAGFAYFLWSLKENAPEQPKEVVAEQQTVNKPESEDILPEIPEEEWEFITSLPEYSVEIENKQQDDPVILRLMQCGSFRKQSQAEELRARIALQGLEAQVKTKSGRWYRVILGPYQNKRLAEKDRHTLQRAKIIGCQIWNWNLN